MPAKSDQPRAATQMVGFQTRFREDTRAKLEAAAKENGRSLNSEMVARLEQSLAWDAAAGGNRNRRLFVRIHEAISEIEALTGNKWTADPVTFAAVRRAVLDELAALTLTRQHRAVSQSKSSPCLMYETLRCPHYQGC